MSIVQDNTVAQEITALAFHAVVSMDHDGRVDLFNPAAEEMFGYRAEEIKGRPIHLLLPRFDNTFSPANILNTLSHDHEIFLQHRNGSTFHAQVRSKPLKDATGQTIRTLFYFKDLTKDQEMQSELLQLSYFDQGTGLPNQKFLAKRLDTLRSEDLYQGYIALIDLWSLEELVGTFSHDEINGMINAQAKRLMQSLPFGSSVYAAAPYRLAVHYTPAANQQADGASIGESLYAQLTQPLTCDQGQVFTDCHIGVTDMGMDPRLSDRYLDRAEIALHQVKHLRNKTFAVYETALGEQVRYRSALSQKLRKAMEDMPFQNYVQPQFDLKTGRVIGAETLMRWPDGDNKWIAPNDFIPLAETLGLIGDLTDWSLNKACEAAVAWRKAGLKDIKMAVNISANVLCQDSFASYVVDTLNHWKADPRWLEFEITETAFMNNEALAAKAIQTLHDLGITIAVDDFGTGHASIHYLRLFKLNRLKIDKSFVLNCLHNAKDMAIVETLIRMGHAMGLEVLAEGIENHDVAMVLRDLRCDAVQGFFYAKPFPIDGFMNFCDSYRQTLTAPRGCLGPTPAPIRH